MFFNEKLIEWGIAKYGYWSKDLIPKLPVMTNIWQGWRDNQVMQAMAILQCYKCKKTFFILKSEVQKELTCPRGCGGKAQFIREKDIFLRRLVKRILKVNGIKYKDNGT